MELIDELSSPLVLLSALPWVLLFAWVSRRLLGAKNLSVPVALLTGIVGYGAGLTLAAMVAGGIEEPGFVLAGTVFTILATMVAIVVLELISTRPPRAAIPKVPRLPRPFHALRQRLSVTRRFTEVTRISVRHGLGGMLGLDEKDGAETPSASDGAARRARRVLEEAGGIFVKLGQLLSTRSDLMPLEATREFARLQEGAAPVDGDAIRQVVEEELGRAVDEVFAEFDWEPLAAASLGQVHAARLKSGEEVAVKVQRPGIARVVERDLAIVRRLARIIEARTWWGQTYGACGIAEEFAARLEEELDYRREVEHAQEMQRVLVDIPEIYVHKVWDQLSTSRLLVMERLVGKSVGKLTAEAYEESSSESIEERKALADALLRSELEPMLAGDRFHADPHPGNIFLLDDGRLGLLDFGATGRLDAFERASVISMLAAIRDGDPALLREAVFEVADIPEDIDTRSLDRALARFMAHHLDGSSPDAAALSEVLQVFGAHNIALPPTTTTMFRALVTLEGTINTLVPGYRVVEAAERLGAQLARKTLLHSPKEVAREELMKLLPLLRRAPRHFDRIATLIERGEVRARVSLFSDRRDVQVLRQLVNRLVLTVIGGTLGLASALLLGTEGGPMVTPMLSLLDLFGYIGLAAGAVLILRVVLAALREEQGGHRHPNS